MPRTEQLGPPSAQDTWELAAWKTSAHSLRRLQQQQAQHHSADDLAINVDSGLLSGPLSVGPHLGQNKVLTSHELILQGTGVSTSPQMIATNKISLGVVIGAGTAVTRLFVLHACIVTRQIWCRRCWVGCAKFLARARPGLHAYRWV